VAAVIAWLSLALATTGTLLSSTWLMVIGFLLCPVVFLLPNHRRSTTALIAAALVLSGFSLLLQESLNKPQWLDQTLSESVIETVEFEVLNKPKSLSTGFNGQRNMGVAIRLVKWSKSESRVAARGFLIYQSEVELIRGATYEGELSFQESEFSTRDLFSAKPIGDITLKNEPNDTAHFFNALRQNYISQLSGVTPDSKTLVAGLAIGDVSALSPELSEKMRTVSLTHLVAVSGSNCAIVIGLVYLVAVRIGFGRLGRTVISLGGLVAYVLLVGPDPSVLRAGVMAAAVILAVAFGRRSWSLNALAVATLVLLIADPWLAVEFGFGLSVLATAGILLLAPAIALKLQVRMPRLLALGLAVTIAAQIMCLPLLIQLQPGLATYSVIANLLAGPVVAPVTVLGILGVVLTPIIPSLVGPISWVASFGGFWITVVAETFAQFPAAVFPWVTGFIATVVSVLVVLSCIAWLRAKPELLRQTGLMVLVVVGVSTLSVPAAGSVLPKSWPLPNWTTVACDVGQGDGFVIRSESRVMVVDVGREAAPIDNCLKELGIKTIDLLVLTHFDFDHVGGLEGALRSRTVTTAIVSGFPDDRPAAKASFALLEDKQAEVLIANPKISGSLGEFSWQVLAPSLEATEAEDSNDASVILAILGPEYDLLMLGDLGARGQERISKQAKRIFDARQVPLVLKVSHHGSNDQNSEFNLSLQPELALVSVGKENGYGHPGANTLSLFRQAGSVILRTDEMGSIAISVDQNTIRFAGSGER
jgi:competence protein ComEC